MGHTLSTYTPVIKEEGGANAHCASAIPFITTLLFAWAGHPLLTEGMDFDRFLSASWGLAGSGENWWFLADMMRF